MQDCVYQMPVRDVTDLKQRLTDTWNGLSQSIVDDAVDEWQRRRRACMKEKGGHVTFLAFTVITELECAWLCS